MALPSNGDRQIEGQTVADAVFLETNFPIAIESNAARPDLLWLAKGKTATVIGAFGEDLILHDALNRSCAKMVLRYSYSVGLVAGGWVVNAIVVRRVSMDAICGSQRCMGRSSL